MADDIKCLFNIQCMLKKCSHQRDCKKTQRILEKKENKRRCSF